MGDGRVWEGMVERLDGRYEEGMGREQLWRRAKSEVQVQVGGQGQLLNPVDWGLGGACRIRLKEHYEE